jgi:hypothetical protein
MAGCGDSPTTPSPPPVVNNQPPVISAVVAGADRVEAGTDVEVVATVTDVETPVEQLTYTWSTMPAGGAFTGTGSRVRWRAPSAATSPDTYQFVVTVSEQYTSQGQPQTNTVTSTSSGTHYNDSVVEITGIAAQFYKDFGTYSVSAAECVRNFSNSCSGKAEELRDIRDNRNRTDFRIVGSTLLGSPAVSIGSQRVTAEYRQRCQFEDVEIRTGRRYRVEGGCFLTAVYENWRWWLCESHFEEPIVVSGPFSTRMPLLTAPESLRSRVGSMIPGRLGRAEPIRRPGNGDRQR